MKVAIGTPHYGDVTGEYAFSLAEMVMRSVRSQVRRGERTGVPDIKLFSISASRLARSRNQIMREAIGWGAEFLLWLDADQSFPDDTLLRLLSLDLPVVGVNYPRRRLPTGPTASRERPGGGRDPVYPPADLSGGREVEQVDGLGLGCCLVDMQVMRQIEALGEREGLDSIAPLFNDLTAAEPIDDVGEDRYFFRILKRAGVPIYVDQRLSRRIGHVAQVILTAHDMIAQRDEFMRLYDPEASRPKP